MIIQLGRLRTPKSKQHWTQQWSGEARQTTRTSEFDVKDL